MSADQRPEDETPDREPRPNRIVAEPATVAACAEDYRDGADVRATAARQHARRG